MPPKKVPQQNKHLALCYFSGCLKTPSFTCSNLHIFSCEEHKEDQMKSTAMICTNTRCKNIASYGYLGATALRCQKHKMKNMMHLGKYCEVEGCGVAKSFSFENHERRSCLKHKLPGMVSHKKQKQERDGRYFCQTPGCLLRPSYGEKDGPAVFCELHAQQLNEFCAIEERIFEVGNKCSENGCSEIARYKKKLGAQHTHYCQNHFAMRGCFLMTQECEFAECSTQPAYGFYGHEVRFCFVHHLPGMVKLRQKSCKSKQCSQPASYGFVGLVAVACFAHKRRGMMHISFLQCSTDNCERYAIYRSTDDNIRSCHEHQAGKDLKMIVDLICQIPSCFEPANYVGKGRSLVRSEYCDLHLELEKYRAQHSIDHCDHKSNNIDNCKAAKKRKCLHSNGNIEIDQKLCLKMSTFVNGIIDPKEQEILKDSSNLVSKSPSLNSQQQQKLASLVYEFGKKKKANPNSEGACVNLLLQPKDYIDTLVVHLPEPLPVSSSTKIQPSCVIS